MILCQVENVLTFKNKKVKKPLDMRILIRQKLLSLFVFLSLSKWQTFDRVVKMNGNTYFLYCQKKKDHWRPLFHLSVNTFNARINKLWSTHVSIGRSFKFLLKFGVEESIVNAPQIMRHGSAVQI
jgi:hypothetical protein